MTVSEKSTKREQGSKVGEHLSQAMVLDTPNVYLTGGRDGTVRSWDPHSLRQISVIANSQSWITDMSVTRALPFNVSALMEISCHLRRAG